VPVDVERTTPPARRVEVSPLLSWPAIRARSAGSAQYRGVCGYGTTFDYSGYTRWPFERFVSRWAMRCLTADGKKLRGVNSDCE
jgi:hypothetical protein